MIQSMKRAADDTKDDGGPLAAAGLSGVSRCLNKSVRSLTHRP